MFKIDIRRFSTSEIRRKILDILKEHQEGILLRDIVFWIGAKDRNLMKRYVDELVAENRIWKRVLGANNLSLYYRMIQSRTPKNRERFKVNYVASTKNRIARWTSMNSRGY